MILIDIDYQYQLKSYNTNHIIRGIIGNSEIK